MEKRPSTQSFKDHEAPGWSRRLRHLGHRWCCSEARRPSIIDLFDRIVLAWPGHAILTLLAVFAFFSFWSKDFRLDASGESLVLEHDEDVRYSRKISNRYETKDFVVVTYAPPEELFSEGSLDRLKRLREELKGLERVESVSTILDVPLLRNPPVSLKELETNLKTLESEDADIDLARAEFRDSPLYRNLLVSPDLRSTAIQVNFRHDKSREDLYARRSELREKRHEGTISAEETQELKRISGQYRRYKDLKRAERHQDIADIRAIIDKYRFGARLFLGGLPMIVDDIIQFIKNDLRIFGFGMLCFLVLTLGVIFRRKRWVFLPMLCCVFSVIVMMGLLGLTGWDVTVVSSNFISLQLIFTMSLTIHQIVRYRELLRLRPDEDNRSLIREAVRFTFIPCFYSVLTTMAGFSSLIVCDILPVVNFGYMMTMGLAISLVVTFLFFPASMLLIKKTRLLTQQKEFGRPITSFFARLTENHGPAIVIASVLIAGATAVGIARLEVENSFIDYFKKTTDIYQGMKFIDQELGGTTPLEVLIDFKTEPEPELPSAGGEGWSDAPPDSGGDEFDEFAEFEEEDEDPAKYWFTTTKIERINKVHDYLDGLPATGKVQSLGTLWKIGCDINEGKPLDNFMLQLLFHRMPDDFKDAMVHPYASVENNQARLVTRIKDSMKDLRRDALIKKIRSDLVEKLALKEDRFRLSGLMVLYNNMLQSLFRSQIKTIGYTVLALMLMFMILFQSVKVSLIAIFPNLLSSLTVLGVMGLANIPLDVMTITIVAISVGIAVDNTIHYLHRFRREFKKDRDYLKTMHRCHGSIGNAMFYTSATVTIGFSILAISNFIPSIFFGLLTALAMVMALIAALSLLPRFIIMFKAFGPERAEACTRSETSHA